MRLGCRWISRRNWHSRNINNLYLLSLSLRCRLYFFFGSSTFGDVRFDALDTLLRLSPTAVVNSAGEQRTARLCVICTCILDPTQLAWQVVSRQGQQVKVGLVTSHVGRRRQRTEPELLRCRHRGHRIQT